MQFFKKFLPTVVDLSKTWHTEDRDKRSRRLWCSPLYPFFGKIKRRGRITCYNDLAARLTFLGGSLFIHFSSFEQSHFRLICAFKRSCAESNILYLCRVWKQCPCYHRHRIARQLTAITSMSQLASQMLSF